MGRFSMEKKREERPWKIHPIWRGIGFIWIILVIVMSYALAKILYQMNQQNGWLPVSPELARQIVIKPYTLPSGVTIPFNAIVDIFPWGPHYYIELLFWLGLIFLGFGLLSIVYAFLYRSFGPPRNPYDAVKDPPRRKRY